MLNERNDDVAIYVMHGRATIDKHACRRYCYGALPTVLPPAAGECRPRRLVPWRRKLGPRVDSELVVVRVSW